MSEERRDEAPMQPQPAAQPPAGDVDVPVRPVGPAQPPGEVNGPRGPEPTRFGDWEKDGRCSDF